MNTLPPESPEVEQTSPATGSLRAWLSTNRFLAIFAGIVILGVVALCLIAVIMLGSFFEDRSSAGQPTPFPTTTGGLVVDRGPIISGSDSTTTISVTLDIPATLRIGGQTFTVQPQVVGADRVWTPNVAEDTAVWVYGTVINYVFGLADSAENQALLAGLTAGNEMEMVTQNGVTYTFSFHSRNETPPNNQDIYTQQIPGTTLILVGEEGENRTVVNGRYVLADATANINANTVELGEPVQLGDLQITVTGTAYDPSRPEAPAGFAFYRVDYQVQNVGLTAVDTSRLRLTLTDDLGNQYALSPLASQSGNFPILSGFINAGQSVQATAGYQIPLGLNSQSVQWTVLDTQSNAQIQVVIPFAGGSNAAQQTTISLTGAIISADQITLLLEGQITNLGDQPVVVTERDISLRTADGAEFLLLSTNPPFPWTIPSGQTLQFFVTYQRPPMDSFVFTVLNQPFQLTLAR